LLREIQPILDLRFDENLTRAHEAREQKDWLRTEAHARAALACKDAAEPHYLLAIALAMRKEPRPSLAELELAIGGGMKDGEVILATQELGRTLVVPEFRTMFLGKFGESWTKRLDEAIAAARRWVLERPMFRLERDDGYVVVDELGELVSPTVYEDVGAFSEGWSRRSSTASSVRSIPPARGAYRRPTTRSTRSTKVSRAFASAAATVTSIARAH
jgi:hypothetical protein